MFGLRRLGGALAIIVATTTPVLAEQQPAPAGHIKVVSGSAFIVRNSATVAARPGLLVFPTDALRTGGDGSVGITMSDNSLLSAGPNSVLSLDKYAFDTTTNQGQFDASLRKGSMSVVSGRIAKQSPDAMTVRTPSAILGVRGTEFVVRASDGSP